jgi:hypothetical protein
VRWLELKNSIKPSLHMDALEPYLPEKYSQLAPSGSGLQSVCLTRVPSGLVDALVSLICSEATHARRMADNLTYDVVPIETPALTQAEWEQRSGGKDRGQSHGDGDGETADHPGAALAVEVSRACVDVRAGLLHHVSQSARASDRESLRCPRRSLGQLVLPPIWTAIGDSHAGKPNAWDRDFYGRRQDPAFGRHPAETLAA